VPLTLEQKQSVVAAVADVAGSAHSVIAAEYRGMTVAQMTELRVQARDSGVYMRVVPNTLARRAFEGTDYDCMRDALVGPLVLAFSQEEPGAAARVLEKFAKSNDRLVVKAIGFGGKLLDAGQIGVLATLPTRDEALSQLLGVMKAPIGKFVRTLAEPHAKLVRTIAAVRDQKQAA